MMGISCDPFSTINKNKYASEEKKLYEWKKKKEEEKYKETNMTMRKCII